MKVEVGNAAESSALNSDGTPNGWFVGSSRFIRQHGLRQCEVMEMKWATHSEGFDSGPKPCAAGLGISVLIEGRFLIAFREHNEPWQEHLLSNRGDFVISLGGSEHYYRALTDCTLLTVRLTLPETDPRPPSCEAGDRSTDDEAP